MSCDKCAQLQAIRLELWQALYDYQRMYDLVRGSVDEMPSEREVKARATAAIVKNMSDIMELKRRAVVEREQRNQEEQYDVE